jgi:iron complex outermembrane receptor protein
LTDVTNSVPNIQLTNFLSFPTGASYFIRGIGATNIINTVDPAVATFIDGVYIAGVGVGIPDLFDVERIEVLRGPQGTLFGRNTTAGAILIRSRRPSGEFAADAQVIAGNYGRLDVKGALEFPIGERAAARVSAVTLNSDGWFTDSRTGKDFGGLDSFSVRGVLSLKLNDAIDSTLVLDYTHDESDQFGGTCVGRPGEFVGIDFGAVCSLEVGDQGHDAEYRIDQDMLPSIDNEIFGAMLEINVDVGSGVITSVTGYRDSKLYNESDTDFSFATINTQYRRDDFDQFSEEIRFASNFSERFDFVAGVFYLSAETFADQHVFQYIADPAFILDYFVFGTPGASGPYSEDGVGLFYTSQDQETAAGFFEGNYHPIDKLTLTLGGRYTWEQKDLQYAPYIPTALGGCAPEPYGFDGCAVNVKADESWDNFSPKVGMAYQFTGDVMFYGYYSQGFRSGGFNGQAGAPSGIGPFDEETVDSVELGMKSTWLENRVRFNVAAFWNKYKDLQRSVFVTPTDLRTVNAADATIQGIEAEFTGLVSTRLRIDASIGLLDAKYDEFLADLDADGVVTENSDLDLVFAPDFSGRISATYNMPFGALGEGNINLEYVYTTELETITSNDPRVRRDDVGLLNASIDVGFYDHWRVAVFGRNLTDELYIQSGEVAGATSIFRVVAAPRTYGVELSAKF